MTWRSAATTLAACGLVAAAWTATQTHLHRPGHDEAGTERHAPILHSHLADHRHHHAPDSPAPDDPDDYDETVSIDIFVVHGVASPVTPPPPALPGAVLADLRSTLWMAVRAFQPPAHGPPPALLSGSRAPPHPRPAIL